MNQNFKKVACFLPGLGTPVSLYYTFTSKELRSTALKGLALIPVAVILTSMTPLIPTTLALLAGAYVYWGVIALAGGWGFLTMLVAWRAIEGTITHAAPIEKGTQELIPVASVSEVLPDIDASALLKGIDRLPKQEKQELVAKIVKKAKEEEADFLNNHS